VSADITNKRKRKEKENNIQNKRKEKEKEKENNDLAIVASHDSKEAHLFSKKKECDNIFCEWQMSFTNSLKKGHYFLNFEDEKQRVIKPTYAKGSLCKGDWGTSLQENPQLILQLVVMIQLTFRRILRD